MSVVERRAGRRSITARAFDLVFHVAPDDQQTGAELLLTGSYEPAETALFEGSIRSGMTVVDVGANVGVYTLLAARAAGETGRVVAFEPEPRTFELLARSVETNGFSNVTLDPRAVSATAGMAELYTVAGHSGLASLNTVNARGSTTKVEVAQITLDSALEDHGVAVVDVLKLDAQGAELDVLLGGERMLTASRPLIFFEYWPAGIRNFGRDPRALLHHLEGQGYAFSFVDDPVAIVDADGVERVMGEAAGTDLMARPVSREGEDA